MDYKCDLKAIDDATRGLKDGSVTLLAGQTAGFKTTVAINAALGFKNKGHDVMFLSLDADITSLQLRFISCVTNIEINDLCNNLDAKMLKTIGESRDKVMGRIAICSTGPNIIVDQIVNFLKIRATLRPFQVLIVDGLDLVYSEKSNVAGAIVKKLRILGHDLGFATLGTVSLTREGSMNTAKPELYDIQGWSTWSFEADNILSMYREKKVVDRSHYLRVVAIKSRYASVDLKGRILEVYPQTYSVADGELPEPVAKPKPTPAPEKRFSIYKNWTGHLPSSKMRTFTVDELQRLRKEERMP